MRSWELSLAIDRTSRRPLPQQLVLALVEEIRRGRLAPGDPVPGTRTLATSLGVHRNTVVAAFEELLAQGWLETTRGSHTRVTRSLPVSDERTTPARTRSVGFELRPWNNSTGAFEAVPAGVLDFSGGLPDARLFPSDLLARAYRRSIHRMLGVLVSALALTAAAQTTHQDDFEGQLMTTDVPSGV